MFTTGETVGLAEWIIDDTSLVYYLLLHFIKMDDTLYCAPVITKSSVNKLIQPAYP